MVSNAEADLKAQAAPDSAEAKALIERYKGFAADPAKPDPKVRVANFDGDESKVSELDAVVAYLQMLGTLVDFATYDNAGPNLR